jgi:hypothetical protein
MQPRRLRVPAAHRPQKEAEGSTGFVGVGKITVRTFSTHCADIVPTRWLPAAAARPRRVFVSDANVGDASARSAASHVRLNTASWPKPSSFSDSFQKSRMESNIQSVMSASRPGVSASVKSARRHNAAAQWGETTHPNSDGIPSCRYRYAGNNVRSLRRSPRPLESSRFPAPCSFMRSLSECFESGSAGSR